MSKVAESTAAAPAPGADVPDGLAPVVRGPILRRLGVLLLGVLIGLVLVDRGVGVWDEVFQKGITDRASPVKPDPVLGWTNVPGFVNPKFRTELDRFGNRNPEIPADAPLDEVRIAGYGASRLYGAEGAMQPRIWNYQLEALLSEIGQPARVLNGGVMAYSALQATERALRQLPLIEPDLVFVVLSPRAQVLLDPHGSLLWRRYGDGPDDVVPADVVEGWPESTWPVVAHLHGWLSSGSAIYRRSRARFQVGGNVGEDIQKWMLSGRPQPEALEAKIDATLEEVVRLAHAVEEAGGEFRAFVMPESHQDSEEAWRTYLRAFQGLGAPPLGTPRREPNEELVRRLEARGVACWDFFDEGEAMGRDRPRFYMDPQGHWSHPGHQRIARALAQRLADEQLVADLARRRAAAPRSVPFRAP